MICEDTTMKMTMTMGMCTRGGFDAACERHTLDGDANRKHIEHITLRSRKQILTELRAEHNLTTNYYTTQATGNTSQATPTVILVV